MRLCFMIELFSCCFTVKGTVLQNNGFFFNMLWPVVAVCFVVNRFIAKSAKLEKPVLHREPPV
jgi:hypothetical protein